MNGTVTAIETETLERRRQHPDHAIVDVRPTAAYNGWRSRGEARGGHVPGARSLPLAWTENLDWIDVVDEKGLDEAASVTVYGYEEKRAREGAAKLGKLGLEDVAVYPGFVDEWLADGRPLRSLERYERLVHPEWLRAVLDGEQPEAPPDGDVVVCHAHFENPDDYREGHIPSAVPLNTIELEEPETWNRRSPQELEEALADLGIRHDTTVVLYGRYTHPTYEQTSPGQSAGHLAAMRCAAIMLYAGVEDVRVLNGGVHAWENAGFGTVSEPSEPEPVASFGAQLPGRPSTMVDLPEARELLEAEDGDLVSVRSRAEFVGERSGYHYIDEAGRIPGAVFGNCGSDAYHMENYRNFDYTTREFEQVEEAWRREGIVPDKRIAFYCGTGWRGSEAFLNAYWMGWPDVAVYDGGWLEWSREPSVPNASGSPDA